LSIRLFQYTVSNEKFVAFEYSVFSTTPNGNGCGITGGWRTINLTGPHQIASGVHNIHIFYLTGKEKMDNFNDLIAKINQFAQERDWDQFHSPKNLVMALSVEASELMEEFLWLTEEQSRNLQSDKLDRVKDEIGDVLNYTLRLCSKLSIDPLAAVADKIEKNRKKYPVELAKGSMRKYTELRKGK
jgi:NTP pyrophosphatase (non-canonical NTP hydrolase)